MLGHLQRSPPAGAEVLLGTAWVMFLMASPTARSDETRDTFPEAAWANAVSSRPPTHPREAARMSRADAIAERRPATAPSPSAQAPVRVGLVPRPSDHARHRVLLVAAANISVAPTSTCGSQ